MTDFVVYIATASLMLSKVVNCMCCEISVFENALPWMMPHCTPKILC
jgi:hypothetical protein